MFIKKSMLLFQVRRHNLSALPDWQIWQLTALFVTFQEKLNFHSEHTETRNGNKVETVICFFRPFTSLIFLGKEILFWIIHLEIFNAFFTLRYLKFYDLKCKIRVLDFDFLHGRAGKGEIRKYIFLDVMLTLTIFRGRI